MKTGGYYFCDPCEENAFGETCWKCHQAARWIPMGSTGAPPVHEPAPGEQSAHRNPRERATPSRGSAWFAEMRRVVAAAPDPKAK